MPQWTYDDAGNLVYINEDGTTTSYGSTPEPLAPTPDPAPQPVVPDIPDLPPQAPGSRQSYGYSYSGTPDAAQGRARNRRDQAFAEIDQQAADDFDRLGRPTIYAAQKQMDAVATRDELANAPSLLAAESAKSQAAVRTNAFLAEQEARFAREEQNASLAAQAVVDRAKTDYVTEVERFRSMNVDPNSWFKDASGAAKGATLFSAFAAGFLTAGGVENDIMGTLNRAIDRTIDAQKANIARQGQTVDMFGQLYQMAREKSATEAEARLRVRGMLRASAEKAVLSELARYDAPIAQAKAAQLHASYLQELNKDMIQLDGMLQQRALAAKGLYLDAYRAELQAAQLQWEKDQAAAAAAERAAAANQLDPKMLGDGIWDPDTGGYFGYIGHLSDSEKKWTRDQFEGAAQMQRLAKEYKELAERSDPNYDGPLGKVSQDEVESWKRAAHGRYISAKTLYLSGKAATNVERKSIEEQFPFERWLRSDVGRTLASEIRQNHEDIRATANSRVLSPEDMVRNGLISPGQYQRLKAVRGGGGGAGYLPSSHAMNTEANDLLEGRSGKPNDYGPVGNAMMNALSPENDPDKGLEAAATVAINETVRTGDPAPLADAIKKVESIVTKGRGGVNHQEAAITLDRMARRYYSLTGDYPPGKTGEMMREADAQKAMERSQFQGVPTPVSGGGIQVNPIDYNDPAIIEALSGP